MKDQSDKINIGGQVHTPNNLAVPHLSIELSAVKEVEEGSYNSKTYNSKNNASKTNHVDEEDIVMEFPDDKVVETKEPAAKISNTK